MNQDFHDFLQGLSPWLQQNAWAVRWIVGALLVVFAILADFVFKRLILRGLHVVASRTETRLDDALIRHRVFHRLARLAPAILIFAAAPLVFPEPEERQWVDLTRRLAQVWMVLAVVRAISAALDAVVAVAREHPATRDKPVRSYTQVAMILVWLAAAILAISALLGMEPWGLLTGLGALTAILLLIFKDSIVGFVASVQIASSDMLRRGDWVEIPQRNVDGEVEEITLHTVWVRNWDRTLSLVPTPAFVTDAYKNWRGMQESRVRRIKRAILVDQTSVRFRRDGDGPTNLGEFREYLQGWVGRHPKVSRAHPCVVRQLPPGVSGVPLEVYAFTTEQDFGGFEAVAAGIVEHALAKLPEFGLRVAQQVVAADPRAAAGS
jgi:miniconductance mechanosensitive channel